MVGVRGQELSQWGKSTQSFFPCLQLEVSLEEIPGEGLLVSWAFTDRPDLSLTVLPKLQAREVRRQSWQRTDNTGWAKGALYLIFLFLSAER